VNLREGEIRKTWFRTERFYSINGEWYLSLRNGETAGPFDTKADAEIELLFFLRDNHLVSETSTFCALENELATMATR